MMDQKSDSNLFTPSGCLTAETLEKLALEKLQEKELKLVENHLSSCELCKDSLYGIQSWLKPGNPALLHDTQTPAGMRSSSPSPGKKQLSFTNKINRINERVQARTAFHVQVHQFKKDRKTRNPYYGMVAVAASIILFFGIYYLVKLRPDLHHPSVALEKMAPGVSEAVPGMDTIQPLQESGKMKSTPANKPSTPLENSSEAIPPVSLTDDDELTITENFPSETLPSNASSLAKEETKEPIQLEYKTVSTGSIQKDSQLVADESPKKLSKVVGGIDANRNEKRSFTRESELPEENDVFSVVEQMPEFQGGEPKMQDFISSRLRYPVDAVNKGIQGKVYVSFVVNEDGSITDVKVSRGIGGGCDEEAVRVIKLMPPWKPGKQQGKAVKTLLNLPVEFKLQ